MGKHNRITIDWTEYHLNKVIPKDAVSEHHLIWRMNRIQYNTNEAINKVMINDRKHVALNKFFNQSQSPHEQLRDMVKLREPVLSEAVKEELYAILSLPRWMFYQPWLVKPKYENKELFSDEVSHYYKDKV